MKHSRVLILSMGLTTALAAGCDDTTPDTATQGSAIFGAPVNPIRGYMRNDGAHGIVYPGLSTNTVTQSKDPFGGNTNHTSIGSSQVLDAPWGYKRSDNNNAVVYASTDGHVHELVQSGSTGPWGDTDFTVAFSAPAVSTGVATNVVPYVRTDGINAYVYRSAGNHIIEITSNFGHTPAWLVNDLTSFTGGPSVSGSVFAYIRSDSVNALVYVASDGHVHEISSNFGGSPAWFDNDLFAASGVSAPNPHDPAGYRRSDNVNAVVFTTASGALMELSLTPGSMCDPSHAWCWGQLASDASASNASPSGYVRWDNKNAVVYLSSSNTINEMLLVPGGWSEATLPLSTLTSGQINPTSATRVFAQRASNGSTNYNVVSFEANWINHGTDAFQLLLKSGTSNWTYEVIDAT